MLIGHIGALPAHSGQSRPPAPGAPAPFRGSLPVLGEKGAGEGLRPAGGRRRGGEAGEADELVVDEGPAEQHGEAGHLARPRRGAGAGRRAGEGRASLRRIKTESNICTRTACMPSLRRIKTERARSVGRNVHALTVTLIFKGRPPSEAQRIETSGNVGEFCSVHGGGGATGEPAAPAHSSMRGTWPRPARGRPQWQRRGGLNGSGAGPCGPSPRRLCDGETQTGGRSKMEGRVDTAGGIDGQMDGDAKIAEHEGGG